MAQRPINDAQSKVLHWLAAGGSQDPPTPAMKLSASTLQARGLVRVRRRRGKWTAELTDAGLYFVQHGTYTPKPEPTARAPRAPRAETPEPEPVPSAPAPVTDAQATPPPAGELIEEVPLRQVILRPHPAIKELRDRPRRLPKFAQRRCLLIAHALVTEALARGWSVTPITGEARLDYGGARSMHYNKQSLLLIDAGHAPIGLVFDEVTKRRPHEDTGRRLPTGPPASTSTRRPTTMSSPGGFASTSPSTTGSCRKSSPMGPRHSSRTNYPQFSMPSARRRSKPCTGLNNAGYARSRKRHGAVRPNASASYATHTKRGRRCCTSAPTSGRDTVRFRRTSTRWRRAATNRPDGSSSGHTSSGSQRDAPSRSPKYSWGR